MQIFLSIKWIDLFVFLAFNWLNPYNIDKVKIILQVDKDYSF